MLKRVTSSLLVVLSIVVGSVQAQPVKVTPLGAAAGEFSAFDRALLFEDPTGVRVLYDPGLTVPATDTRLGDVHAIIVSHAHGDHLGSTTGIAATKHSAVIVAPNMATFLRARITGAGACPPTFLPTAGAGNEVVVPLAAPCTGGLGISAKRTVTRASGSPGVEIAAVPANHDSSAAAGLLIDPLKSELTANALSQYLDPANGFVLKFSNGLTAYLSGDTGLMAEMENVIREFYRPDLVVINIGDLFTTGPEEAAFAVNKLLKPKAAIPSHANEAATTGGIVNAGSRTARFIDGVKRASVHVPRSGVTMEFDARGRCTAGCQ